MADLVPVVPISIPSSRFFKSIVAFQPCFRLLKMCFYIKNQKDKGFTVPDDKTITIDVEDKNVVINCCFGTKVNETIGRLISAMLAQSIGESVGIYSDAYRINLELPARLSVDKIKDILSKTEPNTIWYLLNIILKNSPIAVIIG